MNPLLSRLQPYPFERLRQLFAGVTPNPALRPISLGIGEPKHPTPGFIKKTLNAALYEPATDLAAYPPTAGSPLLREAFTAWLQRRYKLQLDPATQVLPVNGSREALFAFACEPFLLAAQQQAPAGEWTTGPDQRHIMEQLGIKALRPAPSGREGAPNPASYEESLARRQGPGHPATTIRPGRCPR